tara:strand:+ start:837 stop:1076 length:240 start_codon:yes stop_codon:yes gene_type:complete
MIKEVLNITEAALWLWKDKRSKKYQLAIIDLKRTINEELDKHEDDQDHGLVDRCYADIVYLSTLIATTIRTENAEDKLQ